MMETICFDSNKIYSVVFYFNDEVNRWLIRMSEQFCVESEISLYGSSKPHMILMTNKLKPLTEYRKVKIFLDELPYSHLLDFLDNASVSTVNIKGVDKIALFINSEFGLAHFKKSLVCLFDTFSRSIVARPTNFIHLGSGISDGSIGISLPKDLEMLPVKIAFVSWDVGKSEFISHITKNIKY